MRPVLLVLPLVMLASACAIPRGNEMLSSPYRAAGNEPFWHITMTDTAAIVERPGMDRTQRAINKITATEKGWQVTGEGMTMSVSNTRCENDMSGAPFEHTVTLVLDGGNYQGCGGRELPPERIEMTQWTVRQIGNQVLTTEVRPFLAIDAQGNVSGSDGCNRMRGGFELRVDGARHKLRQCTQGQRAMAL